MDRRLQPLPLWVTLVALGAAVGLVAFLALTLRQESMFDDATERALQSSLLPDEWSTYGADVWSIGYPNTWGIDRELLGTDGSLTTYSLHFHPVDGDEGDYLRIEEEARALEEIEVAFAETSGVTRSEFRFAGYPAVKFSTYRRDEYFVSYEDTLYRIATDYPKNDEIGIMLATIKFIE